MPDGSGHVQFQILEIHVPPAKCQKFAHSESGACIQQCQGPLSDAELAEQELDFAEFENVGNALPLCTLTNELDRISICPFVSHRVCKERTHQVPNLCL